MKGICLLVLLGLISARAQDDNTYEKALSRFSSKLYKEVSGENNFQNVLISPLSVHAVLSMVYQGSEGSTKQVLASQLNPQSDEKPESLAASYHSIIYDLNTIDNVTLKLANKVYLQEGALLNRHFEDILKSQFLSKVQQLNFKDPVTSVGVINRWVSTQTADKINDLLKSSDIDEATRLVLVNAIYFKGEWNLKFDPRKTQTQSFYNGGLETGRRNVPIMHQLNTYLYSNLEELDASLVSLPYKNNRVSLVVVLPNKKDGLGELERKLIGQDLQELLRNRLYPREIQLGLPKFKIETRVDLGETLSKLGLEEIFDQSKANFTGILANKNDLYVNKAVQKAFLEVNEEGAEAAAATFLTVPVPISAISEPLPPLVLQVDHPFIFFIVVKASSEYRAPIRVLFQGRITSL